MGVIWVDALVTAALPAAVAVAFARPLTDEFWFIDDPLNFKQHGESEKSSNSFMLPKSN